MAASGEEQKAKPAEAAENALNETRILVLVAQVLIGFQFQGVFQNAFARLPTLAQKAWLAGICLMLIALALFLLPAACHQIAGRGEVTLRLNRLLTGVTCLGLLPFSVAFSGDIALATGKILNSAGAALVAGSISTISTLFLWYGIGLLGRYSRTIRGDKDKGAEMNQSKSRGSTPLEQKIKFALMEARVVLPGTQALLGFQLAAILMEGFERLPMRLKEIHLVGLLCIAASAAVLMAPAAFHRIAESGEDSERLHRFTSRMLLGGMFLLAAGLCADLAVVFEMITRSPRLGSAAAVTGLAIFCGLWFGYSLSCRSQRLAEPGGRA